MRKLLIMVIFISNFTYSQQCDCDANFKWLKETIEENDAGFQVVIKEKGTDFYKFHNESFEKKIKTTTDLMACHDLLKSWLRFFRKEHLFLFPVSDKKEISFPKKEIDIEAYKKDLAKKDNVFIEGIWTLTDYEITVIKENEKYIGIVTSSNNENWKIGEIKFRTDENLNKGVFYLGDNLHTPKSLENIEYLTEGILILDNFYLKRKYPKHDFSKEEEDFLTEITAIKPIFKQLNETTNYLRIPSFDYSKKEEIKQIIDNHFDDLTNKENLIIDLRGNGGGADISFSPLIRLIYTNPIITMGVEQLSSKINNQSLKEELDFSQMSQDDADWYKEKLTELENNIGKYIDIEGVKFMTNTRDTIYSKPNNIAILTDKYCASSTEEFLLMAKQSKKVKLFGHPTAGALDVSNLNEVISPTNNFKLYYATTKSIRNDYKIDDIGIQPDFYLHKYIWKHKWLEYVSKFMN